MRRSGLAAFPASHIRVLRSLCYTDLRLGGTSGQGNCLMTDGIDPDVFQVVIVEVPVPCYPGVDHPAIETRAHREPTRPILRGDNGLEAGHMRISHADQPTLHDSGDSSLLVSDADHSAQGRLSKVQVLLVLENLHVRWDRTTARRQCES